MLLVVATMTGRAGNHAATLSGLPGETDRSESAAQSLKSTWSNERSNQADGRRENMM